MKAEGFVFVEIGGVWHIAADTMGATFCYLLWADEYKQGRHTVDVPVGRHVCEYCLTNADIHLEGHRTRLLLHLREAGIEADKISKYTTLLRMLFEHGSMPGRTT